MSRGTNVAVRIFLFLVFNPRGMCDPVALLHQSIDQPGGNLKVRQKLLGQSDLKTTQRYLHGDDEQMKKIVERMAKWSGDRTKTGQ